MHAGCRSGLEVTLSEELLDVDGCQILDSSVSKSFRFRLLYVGQHSFYSNVTSVVQLLLRAQLENPIVGYRHWNDVDAFLNLFELAVGA